MSQINITYLGSLYGHNGIVSAIVVGKDSNGSPLVVSGGRDKRLIIWELNLNKKEENVDPEKKENEERTIGKPLKSLSGHSHFISSLSISNDSKYVVSGSWDKTIRLWDLNTFKTKKLIKGHEKDVLTVAFSSDSRYILSGSMDKKLKVWNTVGECKHESGEFQGWVSCISHFKRHDKKALIAVGSWDQTVSFYDSKDLNFISKIEGFDYGVVSTNCDEEGEFMFTAEKNGKIRVHKITEENNFELKSTIDVNADLHAIAYESKYYVAIPCATSKGLTINVVDKVNKSLYTKDVSACHSLAWDESKTLLFAGFADGAIRVFNFSSEQQQ